VCHSVSWVVAYGLEDRMVGHIEAIGVDEIHVKRRGKVFWTLVYQIDSGRRRLLWIGEDRTKATFHRFFDEMGPEVCASIRFVCTDMWKAYLSVVKKRLGNQAVHVIDRFHVVKRLLKALDEMRRKERSAMAQAGAPPLLKNLHWAFLKRRSRWTKKEKHAMAQLERAGLAVVDARLLVEGFDRFWSYRSIGWARKFLAAWVDAVRRKRRPEFAPLKRAATTLEKHSEYLLNFIRSKGLNSGVVEGLNRRLKLASNRSGGFRTDKARKIALYHELGKLPLPPVTHSFF